jgi:transcriptional regulator with XRE-family HTH domain
MAGRARARSVAARLGVALRDARRSSRRTQAEVAARAGVSQTLVSRLELGHGHESSLETWACVAAAVGEQLVGFLELAPGATPPRDIEHLRRQSALIETAAAGGWTSLPEFAIDRDAVRSRSIDVALIRATGREAVAAEIWDWFDDVGASLRGLDAKVAMLRSRLTDEAGEATPAAARPWRVEGLFVVRDTRRNRSTVADLRPLFAARFTGSSRAWLRALESVTSPLPVGHGLLWSDRRARLSASRIAGSPRASSLRSQR